jgi:hypothetical protein
VSTILDALRKAQAEGEEKPDIPEPDFPPSPADDSPPSGPDGSGDDAAGVPPPGGGPARSYKAVGVVVLGVSLGLLLGRLLLPLATAPPDSSDMLADGVAEKHEEILAAVEAEEDKGVSPAERRLEKREEAQRKRDDARAERRDKRERETADAADVADDSGDNAVVSDGAAETAKVPVAGIAPVVSPGGEDADLEGDGAAAAERPATAGVVAPATVPRPESPPLTAAELRAARAGAETATPPASGNGAPTVLGNVLPPPVPAAPAQAPPGLEALGSDPLAGSVASAASPKPQGSPQPVTKPPPPPADAPPPQALPGAPDDAPKIRLLFIQWSQIPEKRVVSLRSEGGGISVVREGDIVQGMRLAAIHPSGVEFQWRGKSFAVPVSRY